MARGVHDLIPPQGDAFENLEALARSGEWCSLSPMTRNIRILALFMILFVVAPAPCTADDPARVLIVVTNHGRMGDLDEPTGYWLAEVAHPWAHFVDAGFLVDFASPVGGFSPMDPRSFDLDAVVNRRFWEDLDVVQSLLHNRRLADLDAAAYDALYFAGGHGTMWDFPGDDAIERSIREVWSNGGVVAAVCHGPAALVDVTLDDGTFLVDGKRVSAFTVDEEEALDLQGVVPFLLTERLAANGAEVVTADRWQGQVVVDGRLVTGQNPASASEAGERIVELVRSARR